MIDKQIDPKKLLFIKEKMGEIFTFGIYIDNIGQIRYRWVCQKCFKSFDCGEHNLTEVFEEVRKHYFNWRIENVKNKKVVEDKTDNKNKKKCKKIQQKKSKK